MQNPWQFLKQQIEGEIKKHVGKRTEVEEAREGFGDFTLPCFMLSEEKPYEVAKQLAIVCGGEFLKEVRAVGPYLNFYIDWQKFGQVLFSQINEKYGSAKSGKKAVIDFSSPNPAHPFHLGTIRSTVIGESVSRILENHGFEVKRLCYVNDLGKQAAILALGYQKTRNRKPTGKPDVWLGKIYFDINQQMSEALEKQAFEILKKYESDEKFRKQIKKVFKLCIKGFAENWKILGTKFDKIIWESSFVKEGISVIEQIKSRKLCFESEGALILKLEPALPNTVLLRSDGTGLYLTRDLAFAFWRESFKPDLNIYVVAEDQNLHFKQLFRTLELLDHTELAKNSVHLGYSLVLLQGEKMSARKGWFVTFDELLEEGISRAKEEIRKRWPDLSAAETRKRAEQVAVAAINYFIIKYSPEKTVNFSLEEALRFDGDTGPYLLYTYARAKSILRKSKAKKIKSDASLLTGATEVALLKLLAKYPDVLERSARDLRPHYLANYLHDLADAFNKFYESQPVLKAEKRTMAARLRLVDACAVVLKSGLALLGIKAIEKM